MTDQEILRAIRQSRESGVESVNEEKVLRVLKEELQRRKGLDPDPAPLGRMLRARLHLQEKLGSWISNIVEAGQPNDDPHVHRHDPWGFN